MAQIVLSPVVRSLKDYQYLHRHFSKAFYRQIDRLLTVEHRGSTLLANSFFLSKVIKTKDRRAAASLGFFSEPIGMAVFLHKSAKAFHLNFTRPSRREVAAIVCLFGHIRLFIENRFLVPENFNEYDQLARFRRHLATQNLPRCIYIVPSLDCNFCCPDCLIFKKRWSKKMGPALMKPDIFDRLHEYILNGMHMELKGPPPRYIFYGGEPLMNKPLIKHCLERIQTLYQRGAYGSSKPVCNIVTNGSLLDQSAIAMLKRHRVAVGLSLDGVGLHNDINRIPLGSRRSAFSLVMRAIRLLEMNKVKYGLSWTIGPSNIDFVPGDIDWVVKHLTANITMGVMVDMEGELFSKIGRHSFFEKMHRIYDRLMMHGIREGRLTRYLNLQKKVNPSLAVIFPPYPFYCAATGGGQIIMRPDGKIGQCQAGLVKEEEQWQRPEAIGDLFEDPVRTNWLSRTPIFMKECYLGCDYFSRCPGGCAYRSAVSKGSIYLPNEESCMIERFYIERALIEGHSNR